MSFTTMTYGDRQGWVFLVRVIFENVHENNGRLIFYPLKAGVRRMLLEGDRCAFSAR